MLVKSSLTIGKFCLKGRNNENKRIDIDKKSFNLSEILKYSLEFDFENTGNIFIQTEEVNDFLKPMQ